ncbi:MAG: alpha/beta hydrolase [Naasia sp.]|uniref:alpha/beta fold hydrolase n=1 Tax=Naasia sp. TaxID=2546198 RepID=UPI002632849F|nr:alpha/beta hydrolase [Naasia sp.]MCU1571047.1 alpha/beta hydrolase [Naasia sp.]
MTTDSTARDVRHAVSADGTRIAYEKVGSGPALVLVDGAMCARDFGPARDIAARLQDRYTVYFYDRRGRGESGDTPPYSREREYEDLAAVLVATGETPLVMGQSSGAGLALEAAAAGVPMRALATYEAPYVGLRAKKDGTPRNYLAELEALLASGKRAQVSGYFLVKMVGAPWFVPYMMRMMPKVRRHLEAIAPTIVYDAKVMWPFEVPDARFAAISIPTLVLAGSKGASEMLRAQERIAAAIPGSAHAVLEGQTHQVSSASLDPKLHSFFTSVPDARRAR